MFFIMILFAALFLMLGLMWMARPQHVDEDELPTPVGDVHQVAWVIGGPKRVLATWWALLRADGVIQEAGVNQNTRRPVWSFGKTSSKDPWLARAASCLPDVPASQADVAWAWRPLLSNLETSLRDQGILAHKDYASSRRVQVACASVAWIALSVILMINGVAYAWLLLGSALLVMLLAVAFGDESSPRLTTLGTRLRQKWVQQHMAARRAPQNSTLGFAVAVGGLAVLVGTPFEAYADPLALKSNNDSGGCGTGAAGGAGGGCGSVASASAEAGGGFATGGGIEGGGLGGGGAGGDGGGSSGCGGGGG